jgi:hypothetical protein
VCRIKLHCCNAFCINVLYFSVGSLDSGKDFVECINMCTLFGVFLGIYDYYSLTSIGFNDYCIFFSKFVIQLFYDIQYSPPFL